MRNAAPHKQQIFNFLQRRKYEVLLFALIQHLFIGIFLPDLVFYTNYIWPINMLILGVASIGVFIEKGRWEIRLRNVLFVMVLGLPLLHSFARNFPFYMFFLSIIYMLFFAFIFYEVLKFLLRPSYINVDIISASACGYFLLIEVCTFLMQLLFYNNPDAFINIHTDNPAATYIDFVYFSCITVTSIGYGDILPNAHYTKLVLAFFGVVGQFYSVVLIGILISKFSNNAG